MTYRDFITPSELEELQNQLHLNQMKSVGPSEPTFFLDVETFSASDEHYFSLPEISNSDISNIMRYFAGEAKPNFGKAFSIGSEYHQRMLEENPLGGRVLGAEDETMVSNLVSMSRKHEGLMRALNGAVKREVIIIFTEPYTGVRCKIKVDAIALTYFLDLKSTSARRQFQFEMDCILYNYYKQLAFYNIPLQANYMEIWAASKKVAAWKTKLPDPNEGIFHIRVSKNDRVITEQLRVIRKWLWKIKEENLFNLVHQLRG